MTQDQLQFFIEDIVKRVETIILDSQRKEITSKEWLTSKEVCDILKISMTTLHDWSQKGLLIKHKIGRRIMFRHDEVLESLKRIESKNGRR